MTLIRPQILRQTFILIGLICCGLMEGLIFGQMSGMLSDLQKRKGSLILNDEEISWIASMLNVMSTCGFLLATILSAFLGRRATISILSAPMLLCWIMVYYAESMTTLIVSRILAGTSFGGVLAFSFIATGEYTSPRIRGLCIFLVSAVSLSAGLTLGHILCIVLNWRMAALIAIIPTTITVITPWFWVESPIWLASMGKFKECEDSFRALHGHSRNAEKELLLMIENEKQKRVSNKNNFQLFVAATKRLYLWKMYFLFSIIGVYRIVAGKIFFMTYGLTMMQDITGTMDILLFTLLVDSFNIIGSCLSCFLISRMKSRSLLFSLGISANVLLVAISASLYFQQHSGESKYLPWINSALIGTYFIMGNAGPYPVLEGLVGELMPIEIKLYSFLIVGGINSILCCFSMKVIPDMIATFNYSGTFLLHAVGSAACLVYLWFYIPETKGKTLLELESFIKNHKIHLGKTESQNKSLI